MYIRFARNKGINFRQRLQLECDSANSYTFSSGNKTIILEGKFYYYNLDNDKSVFLNKNMQIQLARILKKLDIDDFINNTEGEYCGISIDYKKGSLKIFGDKLTQKEIYYFYNDDIFIATDDCQKIIKEIPNLEYEQNSLVSAVLLYVPKGHTLFKKIRRLKFNESIAVTDCDISMEYYADRDIKIEDYDQGDLLRYEKILKNSILSRASNDFNLVYSSGGWDSTMILAILREHFDKKKVKALVMKFVFPDGSFFNEFEVYKVKKLCRTFNVGVDEVEIDYRKKELYKIFDEIKNELFLKNLFYLWPTRWGKVVNYITKKYGSDVTIFNGEGADSLHNYGFSQYISLPHDNSGFNEYSDKMKSYLFGPDFFRKLKNNTFLNDSVYKIFLYFNQDKDFADVKNLTEQDKIFYYLLSFVYSDVRLPFREVGYKKYIKKSALDKFKHWLREEYFKEAISNINENNLYYYFSYLYALFHLQSPQVRIFREGLSNVRFPFIDSNLFKYLYKMPQDFGRGLNFNRIKFPLKELAGKVFSKAQLEIIESGPHSYLSEIKDINIYDAWLLKGAEYSYMRDRINVNDVLKAFHGNAFSIGEIKNLIGSFKHRRLKNISEMDARSLLIFTLLSGE